MRTTLTLDQDVFEAASSLADAMGKRLGEVLSMLARKGLAAHADFATENGLPVFQVPKDSPIIPSGRARELLAEDDL